MANPGYVRSTDGNDADNGSTWALANATLAGAMADHVAGDRIWVSNNHAETQATAITISVPGTFASPCQILFGDDAAEPPTALTTSGSISTTTTASITVNGSFYWYGGTLSAGSGGGSSGINLGTTNDFHQVWDTTTFFLNNSNSSVNITLGGTASIESSYELNNCTMRFGSTGQRVRANASKIRIRGGGVSALGSAITAFMTTSGEGADVLVDGFDLSACAASVSLVYVTYSAGRFVFRNCKLPASWSGTLLSAAPLVTAVRCEMWNCSAADTNYAMWVEDYTGSIKHETTITRTGGASDGDTAVSWKMASSANAEYPTLVLYSPEIFVPNTTTGAAKTLTVEIAQDGTTTALNDDEIWLDVEYLGTSGTPLALFADDAKADVLASAAAQTDSTETWSGLSGTNKKQKLSVTITPQEEGVYICRVCLAKASTTVYVDPKVTVS